MSRRSTHGTDDDGCRACRRPPRKRRPAALGRRERLDTVCRVAGRSAAWLARQSGGLEVPSSNLGAPIGKPDQQERRKAIVPSREADCARFASRLRRQAVLRHDVTPVDRSANPQWTCVISPCGIAHMAYTLYLCGGGGAGGRGECRAFHTSLHRRGPSVSCPSFDRAVFGGSSPRPEPSTVPRRTVAQSGTHPTRGAGGQVRGDRGAIARPADDRRRGSCRAVGERRFRAGARLSVGVAGGD